MTKEHLLKSYNVDADKVKWQECENGGYKWKTSAVNKNGYYINQEENNYL